MTQTRTPIGYQYSLPGAFVSATGIETESIYSAHVVQQLTFTIGGAPDPLIAEETFTIQLPSYYGGTVVTYVAPIGATLTVVAAGLTAAWVASLAAAKIYAATSALAVGTLVAKSANLSIAPGDFTVATTGAHTITMAQTVAASAPLLRMGLLYVYNTTEPQGPAVASTPRRDWPAMPPTGATVVADFRGAVGREVNSTTLAANFDETLAFDAYPAGHPGPGVNRGEVCVVVDPASPGVLDAYGATTQVHWVIAAGAYSVIGSVASAADGGNTIRLDNTTPRLARVTRRQQTITMGTGAGAQTVRLVTLKVNQTN